MKPQITPVHIAAACIIIAAEPKAYAPRRPLPTTPARRRAAIIAAGRDALVAVLLKYRTAKPHQLTAAIRAGHAGDATDFEAINIAGAKALGIWEE